MQNNIQIIKDSEGLVLTSYKCEAGRDTIGYGSTIKFLPKNVRPGDSVTQEQAEQYLRIHLELHVYPIIEKSVKVPLNQYQYDAIASLIYNIGSADFNTSTLLKKLNARNYKGASEEFLKWRYVGKRISKGLEIRRAKERALFDTKIEVKECLLERLIKLIFNI